MGFLQFAFHEFGHIEGRGEQKERDERQPPVQNEKANADRQGFDANLEHPNDVFNVLLLHFFDLVGVHGEVFTLGFALKVGVFAS